MVPTLRASPSPSGLPRRSIVRGFRAHRSPTQLFHRTIRSAIPRSAARTCGIKPVARPFPPWRSRYEAYWRAQPRDRRDPARFLAREGSADAAARLAVLRLDMTLRWEEAGELAETEWYRDRFPDLGNEELVALAYEEFCLREESGKPIEPQNLYDRFPAQREGLTRVLGIHELVGPMTSTVLHPSNSGRPDVPFPEVGETIAGFRLVELLGEGAFARVFLGHERQLADRQVALKVTRRESREPQTLARLQHTHIVPVFSYQLDPATGLHLLCMPYFGRVTLANLLAHPAMEEARHGADILAILDQIEPERATGPKTSATTERETFARLPFAEAPGAVGTPPGRGACACPRSRRAAPRYQAVERPDHGRRPADAARLQPGRVACQRAHSGKSRPSGRHISVHGAGASRGTGRWQPTRGRCASRHLLARCRALRGDGNPPISDHTGSDVEKFDRDPERRGRRALQAGGPDPSDLPRSARLVRSGRLEMFGAEPRRSVPFGPRAGSRPGSGGHEPPAPGRQRALVEPRPQVVLAQSTPAGRGGSDRRRPGQLDLSLVRRANRSHPGSGRGRSLSRERQPVPRARQFRSRRAVLPAWPRTVPRNGRIFENCTKRPERGTSWPRSPCSCRTTPRRSIWRAARCGSHFWDSAETPDEALDQAGQAPPTGSGS